MALTHSPTTSTKFLFALGSAVLTSLGIALRAWQSGTFTPDDATEILTVLMGSGAVWLAPNLIKVTNGIQLSVPSSGNSDSLHSDPHQSGTALTQPAP